MSPEERLKRWRLVLGRSEESSAGGEGFSGDPEGSFSGREAGMDAVLEALYDSDRKGGLGSSSPKVNQWLGDIRKYFPKEVVQLLQRDALERLDLKKMLLEPELLEGLVPDVQLAATLIQLKEAIPDKTRETARKVVRQLVEELEEKLKAPMRAALLGAIHKSVRRTRQKPQEIDWHRTIRANLKHYQPDYQTIIPDRLIGYGRRAKGLREVFILSDQSGSMASSLVYAAILGSIMSEVSALKTRFIAFDTAIVDLTEELTDPVSLLFGLQLGGGTDIGRALAYAAEDIQAPEKTIVVLISDLFEGADPQRMLERAHAILEKGAQLIVLLALDDEGTPAYQSEHAQTIRNMGAPVFACSPERFPELMAAAINGERLDAFEKP